MVKQTVGLIWLTYRVLLAYKRIVEARNRSQWLRSVDPRLLLLKVLHTDRSVFRIKDNPPKPVECLYNIQICDDCPCGWCCDNTNYKLQNRR